jgi:hypothetical protein
LFLRIRAAAAATWATQCSRQASISGSGASTLQARPKVTLSVSCMACAASHAGGITRAACLCRKLPGTWEAVGHRARRAAPGGVGAQGEQHVLVAAEQVEEGALLPAHKAALLLWDACACSAAMLLRRRVALAPARNQPRLDARVRKRPGRLRVGQSRLSANPAHPSPS